MKLYKYMSQHIFDSFMEDPCFRITPSFCQNDPFEFGVTKKDLNVYHELEDKINLHGIISLSKSGAIPSMWSYYCESHKGFCVEFEVDESQPFHSFFDAFEYCSDDLYFASDVIYTSERSYKYTEMRSLEEIINNLYQLYNHYYFVKHISWSNEDEFRLVIPFTSFDVIKIRKSAYETSEYLKSLNMNLILEDDFYVFDRSIIFNTLRINWNEIKKLWVYSFDKGADILFLKRISIHRRGRHLLNPLSKIFLGLNFDLNSFYGKIDFYRSLKFFKSFCIREILKPGEIPTYLSNLYIMKQSQTNFEMLYDKLEKRLDI